MSPDGSDQPEAPHHGAGARTHRCSGSRWPPCSREAGSRAQLTLLSPTDPTPWKVPRPELGHSLLLPMTQEDWHITEIPQTLHGHPGLQIPASSFTGSKEAKQFTFGTPGSHGPAQGP